MNGAATERVRRGTLPPVWRIFALIGGAWCLIWLLDRLPDHEPSPPTPESEMRIRVEPVPLEPPAPVSEQVPESAAAEPVEPPAAVEDTHPVPDQLPAISASYADSIGFTRYVEGMQALGGRFYLYDDTRKKLLQGVDPLSGAVHAIDPAELAGMSPRLRELSEEVAMEPLLRDYQSQNSRQRIKWVLLLPQAVESRIAGQLSEAFQSGALPSGEWSRAEAIYRIEGGRLLLELNRLQGGQAESMPLSLRIGLGRQ